jgi:hypothetical protein
MINWVWLRAREARWEPVPINPAQVAYLLEGRPRTGEKPTTRVVFGHMVGALSELEVEGERADVARQLAGDPAAATGRSGDPAVAASRSDAPPAPSRRPAR